MSSHDFRSLRLSPFRRHLAVVLLVFAGLGTAQGQTVFWSNMDATTSTSNGPSYSHRRASDVAQSFTTGPNATTLVSITLPITASSGSGFNLGLYTDSSSLPGTLLETLADRTTPTVGNNTYTSSGAIVLEANTTYWWVAQSDTYYSYSYTLGMTTSTSGVAPDGWTTGGAYYTTAYDPRGAQGAWNSYGSDSFKFALSASAIPEPGTTAVLAGLLALGFAASPRRRRR